MTEFEEALRARLARNAELEAERAHAESEMDRAAQRQREEAARHEREQAAARNERHAQLTDRMQQLMAQLRAAGDESVVVRGGWSASGEEFVAKVASRNLRPARTLSVTIDRDDDQVLARWHSDLGDALELYHLLEFTARMLDELVLQVVDQALWADRNTPPPFPGNLD